MQLHERRKLNTRRGSKQIDFTKSNQLFNDFLFDLILDVSVNSYGHVEMASSPDHCHTGKCIRRFGGFTHIAGTS